MQTYTIIGGVNGVGKSSFIGSLKAQSTSLGVVIDVDKIAAQNGCSAVDGAKIAISKIDECLKNGYSFTQETTLSGNRTFKTCQRAKKAGYYIKLYYIALNSEEESILRIKNRVKKGGHDICDEDVRKRFKTRFDSIKKILPLCDEALFFDNDNGFVQIGEYKNGELIRLSDDAPVWFEILKETVKD